MKTVKELKEERKVKFDALSALINVRTAEKREFNSEEAAKFDQLEKEIEAFDTRIAEADKVEKMQLRIAASAAGSPVGAVSEKEERDLSKYSLRTVMLAAVENRALSGLEAEMHQEGLAELQRSGANTAGGHIIPQLVMDRMFQRNVTATGQTSVAGDQGGVTIAKDVVGYVAALRERSLLLQRGAQYLTGLVGNFDVPTESALFAPGFKTEIAASDKTSPTFGKVSFSPKRLAGHMDISKQLLIQSSPAIEALLRDQIVLGHANALDKVGFNGSSANNEPVGILNDAGVAVVGIGANGGAITQALLEDLELALRNNTQYAPSDIITNAKVRKVLRNLKLDAGSGLFVWDRNTNSIDGKPAFDTTHVPSNLTKGSGTNLSAIIEGVFSDCWFGQWGGTEILADPYTQATLGMVRMVSNQYVDFNVVRKKSFAVIKDITTP